MKYQFFEDLYFGTFCIQESINRKTTTRTCAYKKKTNTFKYMSALVSSSILYKDTHFFRKTTPEK